MLHSVLIDVSSLSGEAFKLQLDGPLYVGGVDPSLAESSKSALGLRHHSVPPTVWSSALG